MTEKKELSAMNDDLKYMQRCLQLASYGAGYVAPNPRVGAVLVYNDEIIGEGYHQRYGEAHAEPNAIKSVKDKELLKKSTLYVSLEPCSHFGNTPPCANLIVASQIPRVVIGTYDPNPKVAGRGVGILRNAGIEVVIGVLEEECRELNKRFFVFQEQKRPFVLLKWAQTRDGFIDIKRTDPAQKPLQVSNSITQQLTHQMRSENQSILVSTNTVILDNPSLTVRHWSGKSPIRMTIDRQGRIPEHYKLFDGSVPTLVFSGVEKENKKNVEYIDIDFTSNSLHAILQKIYEKNINSILVEGGSELLNSFIKANLWDEANVEVSPISISEGVPAPVLPLQPVSRKVFDGHDWLYFKRK